MDIDVTPIYDLYTIWFIADAQFLLQMYAQLTNKSKNITVSFMYLNKLH